MRPSKPILFLLELGFLDPAIGPGRFYCPYCLRIEGRLAAFPKIKDAFDIRYVDCSKPCGDLPAFAGQNNQSCLQIIPTEGDDGLSGAWSVHAQNDARRIEDTTDNENYLSARFGLLKRHP